MAKSLKVYLTAPNPHLIHQWRNFGEDVFRALRDECEISIHEIDASTSEFLVRGIRKRELRSVAAKVRKVAKKCPLANIIDVVEAGDDQAV